MSNPVHVKFGEYNCVVVKNHYIENDNVCLSLVDETDGEPVARATVNVSEYHLEKDEILIRNWSENEGIMDVLVDAGLITNTGKIIQCGYAYAYVCKLTEKGKSL